MISSEQLYRTYHSRLRSFIRSRVNDPTVADDLVQDVFLRMHAALPTLRDADRVESWMYQIARNAVADHHRAPSSELIQIDLPAPADEDPATRTRRQLASCLIPMIDYLSPTYRDAVYLSEIEGLTQREVAERLGLSLSGAKSRVQRGRAELRAMLEQCCRFERDVRGHVVGYERRGDADR
jgi:RNA polymerase sigma-70 factor (ECF subfamily)